MAKEGATLGALGSLRSAINLYYASTEGLYPEELSEKIQYVQVANASRVPFSFLPSKKCKGFFPADPSCPSTPRAKAHLRSGIPNNESNSVLVIKGLYDGKRSVYKVEDRGGWLYVADPDGAKIFYEDTVVYLNCGDITICHNALDTSKKKRYFEY
jgi:hypothetical protein